VTVGIIACILPTTPGASTTTTVGTTPSSTLGAVPAEATTPASTAGTTPPVPTSGTTTVPTSVTTTTGCQKDMAIVGGQYVSTVDYPATQPVSGTEPTDLTSDTTNGITFPQLPAGSPLLDNNNQPLYTIDINFNKPGVNLLGIVAVKPKPDSNVEKFAVQFFVPSAPDQPFVLSSLPTNKPLYYNSTLKGVQPLIDTFPVEEVPSPLIGIRFIVLETKDSQ